MTSSDWLSYLWGQKPFYLCFKLLNVPIIYQETSLLFIGKSSILFIPIVIISMFLDSAIPYGLFIHLILYIYYAPYLSLDYLLSQNISTIHFSIFFLHEWYFGDIFTINFVKKKGVILLYVSSSSFLSGFQRHGSTITAVSLLPLPVFLYFFPNSPSHF